MRDACAKYVAVRAISATVPFLYLLLSAGCAVDTAQLLHELAQSARLSSNLADRLHETFLDEQQLEPSLPTVHKHSLQASVGNTLGLYAGHIY